jgi:AAHS family 4-hydroxybenzoate transporter-like MFS transporter
MGHCAQRFRLRHGGALFGMASRRGAGGWIGDRVGRRKALVAAVVLFGIATMAASRAENTTALAVMRVAGGLGFGAAGPNAIALATEWLPLRLRTYVVALLAVGTPAGGMIGAAILPALLPSLGWRGVFGLLGLAAVLLGLILLLVLRESPSWLLRRARTEASRAPQPGTVPMPGPDGEIREAGARDRLFTAGYARLNVGIGLGFAALTAVTYGLGAWMPALLTAAGLSLDQALRASLGFNACSVLGALAAGWLARAQGSRRSCWRARSPRCCCWPCLASRSKRGPCVSSFMLLPPGSARRRASASRRSMPWPRCSTRPISARAGSASA